MIRRLSLILLALFLLLPPGLRAEDASFEPTAEQLQLWQQPDFVRAYLVVVEPGGSLYSVFGHACLHLVCPTYDLDYYFSYESENASKKLLTFLAGRLKMGMIAMTPEEYLSDYRIEGRGVLEYELQLPIDVKRELWRVLDEHVAEGMCLPYDYEARGCAYACATMVKEALNGIPVEYGPWDSKFRQTRRELANNYACHDFPWNLFFIMTIVGTDIDKALPPAEKLIVPVDLVSVWQKAKVQGQFMLSEEPVSTLSSHTHRQSPWFTPLLASVLLLILAVLSFFFGKKYISWFILGIVTLIGVCITYLVAFSTLPCTSWNWLIVPFNPLPAVFWHWRRYWALPYAGILLVWIIIMLLVPHQIVSAAHILIVLAFILVLVASFVRK